MWRGLKPCSKEKSERGVAVHERGSVCLQMEEEVSVVVEQLRVQLVDEGRGLGNPARLDAVRYGHCQISK